VNNGDCDLCLVLHEAVAKYFQAWAMINRGLDLLRDGGEVGTTVLQVPWFFKCSAFFF